ncbi:MAG: MFS transporter [Microbacteriaceae bacterium]|nr:MFS transporter [Microbacteriaceae bacterium]
MKGMFRSLRHRNYRIWFIGGFVGNNGQWMQTTAQAWIVLTVLTSGDATAVGFALALQFLPPLALVGLTGWLADRFDRRRILAASQLAFAAVSAATGTLLLAGVMSIGMMMAFALLLGTVQAFENPTRQAFVSDLVGAGDAPNAVALNSASFSAARLVGPALAGLAIVWIGSGWVFIANAACFLVTFVSLVLLRRTEFLPREPREGPTRFADGFQHVGRRPDLVVLFAMLFVFSAFGMNFPIYASTMAVELGGGADGFGFLTSFFAIGSLTGALVSALQTRPRFLVIVLSALGYGVASLISALMPGFWSYAIAIVFVGFSLITLLTTANSYVQTTTPAPLRGRVFAVYTALLLGSTPVGAPIVGWIAEHWGARASVEVAAIAGFVVCGIGAVWAVAHRRALSRRAAALSNANLVLRTD